MAKGDHADDDVRCMERLRQGDDLALNELMGRWKQPLVSFCLRYTGNRADALEIAQETFVKVHGSRDRYRPTGAFSSWLFTIAANLCRMRARWRARHPEILEADRSETDQDADERAVDGDDDLPGVSVDRKAFAQDLDRAIGQLPHDLRVAFVLFEIQDQSYREAAQAAGCSEKALERRLARARERLRDALAAKWRA